MLDRVLNAVVAETLEIENVTHPTPSPSVLALIQRLATNLETDAD